MRGRQVLDASSQRTCHARGARFGACGLQQRCQAHRLAVEWAAAGSRSESVTTPTATAINAITTISSISVKPRGRAQGLQPSERAVESAPRARAGANGYCQEPTSAFVAFAAGLAVGTEAEDIDLAFHARVDELVGPTPGSLGSLSR